MIKFRIKVEGKNNSIIVHGECKRCILDICGNSNVIEILDGAKLSSARIFIKGNNLKFLIGPKCTSANGNFIVMGNKNYIKIGKECMIAECVDMWATDSHPIFNISELSMPVNRSLPIEIGNHVWIGKNVTILKGVIIGNEVIVGMRSVVTKDIPNNTIVAGNPAKQIKNNITWDRSHITV